MCLSNKHFWPLPLSGRRGKKRRIHFYVLDFKAIGAQEEFTKMSVSVIREEESENMEACLRSPFLLLRRDWRGGPKKNNEPASNLLNSSLIWDKLMSLTQSVPPVLTITHRILISHIQHDVKEKKRTKKKNLCGLCLTPVLQQLLCQYTPNYSFS